MFKTKRDVDRHVLYVLNRIREEKERNSRGFQFAKLYYDIADYDSSKRYLQAFLSVREAVPQAHKLMGQIHEALRDKTRAVESFKRSLELDPEQKDLVLKVCELYGDASVTVNPEIANFWIDQAEKHYPSNNSVFRLKERVVDKHGTGDTVELEQLISTELVKCPSDVRLHVKLLQLYIQKGEVDRAYDHMVKTEKTLAFVASIPWYECLLDTFQVYESQYGCSGDAVFYTHKLFAVATLAYLQLQADDREMLACVKTIHQLDTDVKEAVQLKRQSSEWEAFLMEMKGQLFFLMGTLLLKRAAKGQLQWKDASSYSAVCYLLSDALPAIDVKCGWVSQLPQDRRKFYDRLYMTGCDRLSQGGHMVCSLLGKQDGSQWARKLRQRICTAQGREQLYGLVFTMDKLRRMKDKSYLMQSDTFTNTSLDVPSKAQILLYDSVGYALHCDNLNHLVWLCQRHYSLADEIQPDYEQLFGYQPFADMKYSVPDLSSGDPGSLCQLDVQVFLYGCVRWTAEQQQESRRNLHTIADKPSLLPVCLCASLCSRQQCEWWSAVHRMENKSASEMLSKLWGIVIRGLETIRLVSPNTLNLPLIVHIARTLDERAKEIESLDAEGIVTRKLSAMQNRAGFYWKSARDILDRLSRNQVVRQPKECLFPGEMAPDPAQLKELTDLASFALAVVSMREERYDDALKGFEMLYQPQAAYYMGLIYRKLADSQDRNTNSLSSPQSSQEMAMLTKSKNCLYQALDRLGTDRNEELKEAITQTLDDVACKLISAESGAVALGDSIMTNNSQNYSIAESEPDVEDRAPKPPSLPATPVLAKLQAQKEAPRYPSPTRLEVQLKGIEAASQAQSSRISSMEETVRTNLKLIQELIVQLRESRDETRSLRDQLQMLSYQQGLAGVPVPRGAMPPYPGTPQSRSMMNQSYGAAPFDLPCSAAIPNHMSQYGYQPGMASPARPGSQFAAQDLEDELRNIDGEYYDPDAQGQYYVPESNLVQDWPFGHKAGVEGKSTITYSPQAQGRLAQNNANVVANALRGPSIQYQQMQGQLPMPGPGFFAQNRSSDPQVQPGMLGGQTATRGQLGLMGTSPALGRSPAMSPAMQQPFPVASSSQPPKPHIMPPNAIASPSMEAKPRLIPGSVGVPTPKKEDKPVTQSAAGTVPPSLPVPTSAASQDGTSATLPSGSSPATASSLLTSLAAKHQEDQQTQSPAAPQTPQTQKTIFKGFSFTSTPKVTEQKVDKQPDPAQVSLAAPKPFSSFTLTPSQTKPTPPAGQQTSQQPQSAASPFVLGEGTPSLSFGSLASGSAEAFKASGDFKGFQGTGQQMFSGKSPSPRKGNRSLSEDDKVEEYEPNVDFKPVVELPDLVDVKTGEEEEEKLFGERAKLFRFDPDANQWKERGIGEFKLLKHKETGRVRVLMRREQVLKLCANHFVTKTMNLSPMNTSDKAFVWHALDYAEGEMKMENLAIKFKTAQSAEKFKTIFEKCQAEIPTDETEADATKTDVSKNKPCAASEPTKGDLSGIFKQKEGTWKCDGCLITNNAETLKCPCCNSLKPGVKPEDVKDSKQQGQGVFGSNSGSSGFTFGTKTDSQGNSGFKFGTQLQSDKESSMKSQTGSGFSFGSQQLSDKQSTGAANLEKENETKEKPKQSVGSLSAMFQKADGSWKCDGCLISNSADILKCLCCGTVKPGTKADDMKDSMPAGQAAGSSIIASKFGSSDNKTSGFTFGSQPQSGTQSSGFKFGSLPQPTTQSSGFMFGSQPQTGSQSSGVMLGSLKQNDENKSTDAPKPTTDIFLPEACKPDVKQGSKFRFGSDKVTPTSLATSAGFNVDKDENRYSFEPSTKGNAQSDTQSKADSTTVGEDSILLKLIQEGSADKVQDVNITASGFETSKTAGIGAEDVGSKAFGGFTIGNDNVENTEKEGFSFGSAAANESGFNFGPTDQQDGFKFSVDTASQKPASQPGFNFSFSMTPTSKPVAPKSPGTTPHKPMGITSPRSPEVDEDGLYVTKEDDDSHIYFEPVIDLPDKVDVVTGEEGEEVLFDERAKLYRFQNGEWRERGLGNMKVLYSSCNNKSRILMRREQILKICCNHYITTDIKLNPMPNSNGRALVWFAMDFSDDEPRPEQFSIRFKTAECANEFVKTVEAAKHKGTDTPKVETVGAISRDVPDIATDSNDVIFIKEETASAEDVAKARMFYLPDNFYLYHSRPPCPGCIGCADGEAILNNHGEVDRTADDTVDDDDEDHDEEEDSEDYETEEEVTDEGEDECNSPDAKSGTSYLAHLLTPEVAGKGKPDDSGFVFGGGQGAGFSFASLAASADPKAFSGDADKPFHWQGAGKQLFGAGVSSSAGDDDEGVQQGEDPHFEPIVPLPDLVDVKTGEEDEVAEFCHRAKLFRFDTDAQQWKEKGIGEMKILCHKETGKYRLLMRREQVHKLACNHLLTSDLSITKLSTSETSWCWTAQDFSDGEPRVEQLAVKFKTIELAEQFKEKVDSIQQLLAHGTSQGTAA